MLFSLFLTCVMVLSISTVLLLLLGRRLRIASSFVSLLLGVVVIAASGELAARIWSLPSRDVLGAEIIVLVADLIAIAALRSWNVIGKVFYGCFLASVLTYLAFAAWYTVAGGLSAWGMIASALLFVLECMALLLAGWYTFDGCDAVCRVRGHRPEPAFDASYAPMVSLQIAAYNEPPDMLIQTLRSAEAIDYPNFEVVVIDNNTKDPETWRPVQEYCEGRPNVRFEHVDDWPGYKAGALNLALSRFTHPDAKIVGVIDADYLIDPDYLKSTVGYFTDENIAFVQTPQDYRDYEGDPYLTACADAYDYFFAATMPARNDRNSIIFAGTMGLLRRSVIEGLGGWEEWCITEDSEASLRILKAGYSGLFVKRSFGKGIMPLTFAALKSQRFRWCFGGLQIVRRHHHELMPWDRSPDNHMTTRQRLDYLFGSIHWFNDLIYLAFTLVLLATAVTLLTTHHLAIRPLVGAITLLPAALIGSGLLRALWALRVKLKVGPIRSLLAFANWLSLSWTVAIACVQAMFRSEAVVLRTPKSEDAPKFIDALRAARAETFLAITLWAAAVAVATAGVATRLLLGLFAWQGLVYASSPLMSWMNERAKLSDDLERRRRTEWRRERVSRALPYYLAGAAGLASAGLALVLFGFGGSHAGRPANPFSLPQRAPGDQGPITDIVHGSTAPLTSTAPVSSPSSSTITSPSATESSTPVSSPTFTPTPTPTSTGTASP